MACDRPQLRATSRSCRIVTFVEGGSVKHRISLTMVAACVVMALGLWRHAPASADAASDAKQTVLGPGLYVFQTRIRNATCGDAEADGYVLSFMAAIDGVPGSTSMTMELINTSYFKTWTLKVTPAREVLGESRVSNATDAPESHFEAKWDKDRFKGTGSRSYMGSVGGKAQRCRVNYDVLLRRLDDR